MNESKEWLQEELTKVEAWEKDQGDLWFWEKLGRLPFKMIDKWTPAFIQKKIGTTIGRAWPVHSNGWALFKFSF